ncbi:hypothetical protein AB0D67_28460 [Streptosporangium sp. NPDC048047]|uniref:hypothetical protein n=1 Tax=Streptosporangium sp. NPDC048047 TaxID=3155748 RepID=UPI003445C7A3
MGRLERDAAVVDFTSRLLAGLARTEDIAVLHQVLTEALPWSTFLPPEDMDAMLTELVDTARGTAVPENSTPIALLLTQWRHSAEIYADPALLSVLTREPGGDLGPPAKVTD